MKVAILNNSWKFKMWFCQCPKYDTVQGGFLKVIYWIFILDFASNGISSIVFIN